MNRSLRRSVQLQQFLSSFLFLATAQRRKETFLVAPLRETFSCTIELLKAQECDATEAK